MFINHELWIIKLNKPFNFIVYQILKQYYDFKRKNNPWKTIKLCVFRSTKLLTNHTFLSNNGLSIRIQPPAVQI